MPIGLRALDTRMKAAWYVAHLIENRPDVSVTLFHLTSSIPPSLREAITLTDRT